MNAGAPKFVLNYAVSQSDRRLRAPAPQQVHVDGRTFPQLLAFAAEYGALIKYYDLSNAPDGDWSIFFARDPSISAAVIACLNVSSIREGVLNEFRLLRKTRNAKVRANILMRLISVVLRLIKLSSLGKNTFRLDAANVAQNARHDVDISQSPQFKRLIALLAENVPEMDLNQNFEAPSELWHISETRFATAVIPGIGWHTEIIALIEQVAVFLISTIEQFSRTAEARLRISLDQRGHAPQASLYNAFVLLFLELQNKINVFPQRLLSFYQKKILHQVNCTGTPDRLFLTFTAKDGVQRVTIPKGSRFLAGKDENGLPIWYASERSLDVYPAKVVAMRTLCVTEEPLISDGTEANARISSGRILCGSTTPTKKNPEPSGPLPIFGSPDSGMQGMLDNRDATLGFALTSSVLTLISGSRDVHLRMRISSDCFEEMQSDLRIVGREAGNLDPSHVLAQILSQAFVLSYTSEDKLVPVEAYKAAVHTAKDPEFELSFSLPESALPFVALSVAAKAKLRSVASPSELWQGPVLLARLVQRRVPVGDTGTHADVYPYAFLSRIVCTEVSLSVAVDGLKPAQLTGDGGPIAAGQPFALFGSPAVCGNTLRISTPEIFTKRLDALSVQIDWHGLPQTTGGFSGYYQNYLTDQDGKSAETTSHPLFDNSVFRVAIRIEHPGLWTIGDADAPHYLFRTSEEDPKPSPNGAVASTTLFENLTVQEKIAPAYYAPQDSTVLIQLTSPCYAFGDTIYAQNVLACSLRHMPGTKEPAGDVGMPNPPWPAKARALSLNYRAHASLFAENNIALFHLSPFDVFSAFKPGNKTELPLLPHQSWQGCLMFGLSPPPKQSSLLFEMSALPGGDHNHPHPPVWEQMTSDGWRVLTAENSLLRDETDGMQFSGIVAVKWLPITSDVETLWVRIGVPGDAESYPELLSLSNNAVSAVWAGPGGSGGLDTPLPPASVTASETKLAGIAAIAQPLPSSGGRARLSGPDFDGWMAERLRHKNRGIQEWDYACLALAEDPAIWQAAVLPASTLDGKSAGGHVRLIVVPGPHAGKFYDVTVPMAASSQLAALRESLRSRVSPFVSLSVENPIYVRIAVSARLIFSSGDTAEAWAKRLNEELIQWLSPWPPNVELGTRPAAYFSRYAISEFMRARPYVLGVMSVSLSYDPASHEAGWCYLTSALRHDICGEIGSGK